MSRASVRIVIVNWNSGAQLGACLDSIEQFGGAEAVEVVVVDNGSVDGSARGDLGRRVRLICAGQNLGFGRACNLGAADAASDYLLFLNPDAALREGSLQMALGFMESPEGANVGVCGIRLEGESGEVQHHTTRFPGARTMFTLGQIQTRFDHLSDREVDHVIGAFYLIRRSLFEALGGFDERFFVYLEDLDLSLRVRQAGWKVHYLAGAVGFHKGGGTSDQVKDVRLFYSMRSRLLYARKHFSAFGAAYVVAVSLFVEPLLRIGRALLRRSPDEARQTIRAYRLLWSSLGDVLGNGPHLQGANSRPAPASLPRKPAG